MLNELHLQQDGREDAGSEEMTPQPPRIAVITQTSSYGYSETAGKVAVGDSIAGSHSMLQSEYPPRGYTILQGCRAATTEGREIKDMAQVTESRQGTDCGCQISLQGWARRATDFGPSCPHNGEG